MKVTVSLLFVLTLSACASRSEPPPLPGKEMEAVHDFVATSELVEVKKIRISEQIRYYYVNDKFVIMPAKDGEYLLEFRGPCSELRSRYWTGDMVDFRASARYFYADHDTLRGCRISRIYELPESKFSELESLGDAPGRNTYLPKEQKS